MKKTLFLLIVLVLVLSVNNSYSQEGNYKIGTEIYVIEKVGKKFVIKHEKSIDGWKLSEPYDIDGKIGYDAINLGGIIDFWLTFEDDTCQTGIMERKYGQKNLKINKLE